MKTATSALLGILLFSTMAHAHDRGAGFGFGDFGLGGGLGFGSGLGVGGHHDGDHEGGLFGGHGFRSFNTDRIDQLQTRFSDRFDSLQTQYDDGVANTTDFYSTSTYDTIVNKTQKLSDRYDLFVIGVENGITRIGDTITLVKDDISYLNDLLAEYEFNTTLSATKLERITTRLNNLIDRLTTKVDSLTTAQSTLQTNLPTYQTFQTDLSTFLDTIIAAGDGTSSATSTTSMLKILASGTTLSAAVSSGLLAVPSTLAASASAVPEPAAMAILATCSVAGVRMRRRRSWRTYLAERQSVNDKTSLDYSRVGLTVSVPCGIELRRMLNARSRQQRSAE